MAIIPTLRTLNNLTMGKQPTRGIKAGYGAPETDKPLRPKGQCMKPAELLSEAPVRIGNLSTAMSGDLLADIFFAAAQKWGSSIRRGVYDDDLRLRQWAEERQRAALILYYAAGGATLPEAEEEADAFLQG